MRPRDRPEPDGTDNAAAVTPMEPAVAFLVMAHDRPEALLALLDDLAATGQPVFLHLDRASHGLDPLLTELATRATCIPRRTVPWGGYQQLAAILDLLDTAHRTTRVKRFMLLSNACVPVRPFAELREMLAATDREFIDQFSIEQATAERRLRRLDRYFFMRKRTPRFLSRPLNQIIRLLPRRPFARDFGQARFGGTWWTLSRDFVDWLRAFRENNPGFDRRFRMTQFSDEAYFQTALEQSPFAGRVAPSLTYTDWSRGGAHPKLIDRSDLPAIEATGAFFARKYLRESDPDLSSELSARWRGQPRVIAGLSQSA
jgi:core-2/I-Branching enzyme